MKHSLTHRITALLLTVILLCACLSLPGYAVEKTISTDKTQYIEGEDILVTAYGTGTDWVGLYLPGDKLGSDASIYWYYVEGNEEVSLTEVGDTNSSRAAYFDIPAGEYRLYLLANDGYEILGTVELTVIEDPNAPIPDAPVSLTYERTVRVPGLAEGKVTVQTADTAPKAERVRLYWGNADGILPDYTPLATLDCIGGKARYQLEAGTMFPQEADRILAYALCGRTRLSEKSAEVLLPDDRGTLELGECRYELQVASDIHITADQSHIHNRHFAAMLEDIKTQSPDSIGLFVNGDISNTGYDAEYQNLQALIKAAGDSAPEIYFAMGNHDYFGTSAAEQIRKFLKYTGTEGKTPYHDLWLEGVHFIFLAGERDCDKADLSQTQLDWLKEKLAENRDENRPIYVFLHQGIRNTVAGCFEYQQWHGVIQEEELSAILKDYPEVMLFSGHSHWEMDAEHTMKERDANLPTIFNTAAGAYLWNDECNETNVGLEGSQCYYFYGYDQGVIACGRDIANGKWIASSIYFINYGAVDQYPAAAAASSDAVTSAGTESAETESATAETTDSQPAADSADKAESTAASSADTAQNKKSAPTVWIVVGAVVVLAAAAGIVLGIRKKRS